MESALEKGCVERASVYDESRFSAEVDLCRESRTGPRAEGVMQRARLAPAVSWGHSDALLSTAMPIWLKTQLFWPSVERESRKA